jgi:hypothetical protein
MLRGPTGYAASVPLRRRRHDLRRLPTRDLLHLWRTSEQLLHAIPNARHAALLVARRQQYLDELWRRGAAVRVVAPTLAEHRPA